jgi:hypothetical protein
MEIEGPLKATVGDAADGVSKVIVIQFREDFRALSQSQQVATFGGYLDTLREQIAAIQDPNDRNRAGMVIMLQFCEQLAPHIASGEIDLEDHINLQVQREDPNSGALVDFLDKKIG